MYLRAMVEGSRKDSASAAEGMRTAIHASEEAAALRAEKAHDSTKEFQLSIWQQFAEFLKTRFGRNHNHKPPDGP